MNIICSSDSAYVPHLATMLESLRQSNQREDINLYLLVDNICGEELSLLFEFCLSLFGGVSIIQVQRKRLAGLPLSHHISLATYYRLLIPSLLPISCERALFLDSDIVVNGSISDLYTFNMANNRIAAVRSPNIGFSKERLGLCDEENYFNAGVLLIDCELVRSDDLAAFASNLMRSNPEKIKWWDQDILNLYYRDSWSVLPDQYNSLPCWWTENMGEGSEVEFSPSNRDHEMPSIIHFTGPGACKPWHYQCTHPWAHLYHYHRKQTPWARYQLEGKESLLTTSKRKVKRLVRKLSRLG